jgi:pyridoxine kinase
MPPDLPPTPEPATPAGGPPAGGTLTTGLHGAAYRALESVWSVPLVVSVQSRVAVGHVGNSAAVPVLQWSGCEVADIPTTLLSNHPYYPGLRGRALPAGTVGELLDGITARGVGRDCAGVVSGYLGSPGTANVLAGFLAEARAVNPGLRYVCDPVMGDLEPGLYVDSGLPVIFRDRLLGLADAITPNPFEAAWLSGIEVDTVDGLRRATDALLAAGPSVVVVTGHRLPDTPPDALDTVLATAEGRWRVRTPFVDRHFDGTGDTFTAAFAGAWLTGSTATEAVLHAAAVLAAVVEVTVAAGAKELQLVAARALVADPPPLPLERLD